MQKKTRRRRRSWGRTFLLILFVAVALTGLVKCLIRAPKLLTKGDSSAGAAASAAALSAASEEDAPANVRKDQFYTILVCGVDDGNGNSDTNILVGFDAGSGAIHCVSIPRDAGFYVKGSAAKINSAHNRGGVSLLADTLSDGLGIPVDFTVEVNLKGFEKLVDAIGGVDFDVPIDMDYDDPVQNLSIHFKAGMQHLTGEEAMEVVRFRHNNDGSGYGTEDLGRVATQQAFLKAVARQTLTLSNADKISNFAKIFHQYVTTELKLGELAWFGTEALSIGTDNISFSTLPGKWSAHRSLYLVDSDATLTLVNEALNPYTEARTATDLELPS